MIYTLKILKIFVDYLLSYSKKKSIINGHIKFFNDFLIIEVKQR